MPVPRPTPASTVQEAEQGSPAEPRSLLRTSLLLATSAALGGIAVAIWNRRTLAQMRQQIDASADAEE